MIDAVKTEPTRLGLRYCLQILLTVRIVDIALVHLWCIGDRAIVVRQRHSLPHSRHKACKSHEAPSERNDDVVILKPVVDRVPRQQWLEASSQHDGANVTPQPDHPRHAALPTTVGVIVDFDASFNQMEITQPKWLQLGWEAIECRFWVIHDYAVVRARSSNHSFCDYDVRMRSVFNATAQSSGNLFDLVCRDRSGRYPLAPCISMPSQPALMAFLAATAVLDAL